MHRKEFKISIFILVTAIFVVLIGGAYIFSLVENWSLIDSFYFVTMTATTVGYGDFTPTNNLSKIFTIIYSLSIVPFVLYAFSIVARYQVGQVYSKIGNLERKQKTQEEEMDETERKIRKQRKILKEQTEDLDKQEGKLREQTRLNKEQEEELEEHKKELKGHQKKITEQKEITEEHDKELEVVEDIVEDALLEEEEEKSKSKKKKKAKASK